MTRKPRRIDPSDGGPARRGRSRRPERTAEVALRARALLDGESLEPLGVGNPARQALPPGVPETPEGFSEWVRALCEAWARTLARRAHDGLPPFHPSVPPVPSRSLPGGAGGRRRRRR